MGGRVPHLCLQGGAQFHARAGWTQSWRPGGCLIPTLGLGMRLHLPCLKCFVDKLQFKDRADNSLDTRPLTTSHMEEGGLSCEGRESGTRQFSHTHSIKHVNVIKIGHM